MRQVINKLITEEDLYAAVGSACEQGWKRVKLYFLIGLPTETDEDTLGIVELAKECVALARRQGKNASVTVSVGGFVPKAVHPVPVVRHEHRRGAAPQGQPAARRGPQDCTACRSSGTTRRPA